MKLFKMDAGSLDLQAIAAACDAIKRGELVVFPTETVYGLAADALAEESVQRVFSVKARETGHPLPVQIPSAEYLPQVAADVSEQAVRLAERYWPGPLTLVLRRCEFIPDLVTAGRDTVGVRVPDHPVALALLGRIGTPIVATSANISGQGPPTSAQQAVAALGDAVAVVLDAGQSRLAVPSTVVDVTTLPPRILRQGSIETEAIREILGDVSDSAQ